MRLRSTRLTAVAAAVQQLISAFSPTELFTQGEQGVWYDPSDFTRYMQTGEELVTNGTFNNNGSGWGIGSDAGGIVSFANNEAILTNSTGTPRISSAVAFIPGRRYVLTFDQTGSNNSVYSSGNEVVGTFGSGSNRVVFTATANSINIGFRNFVPGTTFSIRNVSIKELTLVSTATLFQDSAGTTPVTAVEQPVGLMLDKRLGLVQGPELRGTGTVSTYGTSTAATYNPSTGSGIAYRTDVFNQSGVRFIGNKFSYYRISITVASGLVHLRNGDITDVIFGVNLGVGTHTVYGFANLYQGTGTVSGIAVSSATSSAEFTINSIRELPGNHASQSTTTNRPILGVHPNTGVRNILTASASPASTVYWLSGTLQNGITSTKINQGIDVDGLPFCDYRFTGTATTNFTDAIYSNLLSRTPATVGQSFTSSAICRRLSGTEPSGAGLRVGVVEETTPGTYIGITTNAGTISSTQEALYTATRTISTGNQARVAFVVSLITGETIDVTYRIKAAQFEAGTSRSKFQFNYSPLNIVEPGVSGNYYLRCDGIDDFMVTSNIDFTDTDKITAFAGVRKLVNSDGQIFETSDTQVNNTGSIQLRAAQSGAASYFFASRGTTAALASTPSSYPAPISNVISAIGDIAGDVAIIRANGVQVGTSTADQGTGNYGNYPLYLFRRGGISNSFNGNFYGLIIRGALSSTNEIINTEAYMATRTGFTAPVIEQLPLLEVLP